jgi:hypothetical protein
VAPVGATTSTTGTAAVSTIGSTIATGTFVTTLIDAANISPVVTRGGLRRPFTRAEVLAG